LVHLFATVAAEATDPSHAGHEFFQERYRDLIQALAGRIEQGQELGELSTRVTAEEAARMLIALLDGIQMQWLFDPAGVDMIMMFDAFWDRLLSLPDEPSA
jgi:hypothetical protein